MCSHAQTEGIFGEHVVCVHSLLTSALIGGNRRSLQFIMLCRNVLWSRGQVCFSCDMLPQHLVCKYELNCEYCNITLARNKAP